MKNQEKMYTYTSSVNGKTIITKGVVYANDSKAAKFMAIKETYPSVNPTDKITVKFIYQQ